MTACETNDRSRPTSQAAPKPQISLEDLQKKAAGFQGVLAVPEFETTPETIKKGVEAAIATANARLDAIGKLASNQVTFQNTIVALDDLGYQATLTANRVHLLKETHKDEAVRNACADAEKVFQQWAVGLDYRADVFAAVVTLAKAQPELFGEDAKLLAETLRDYRRAGLPLPKEQLLLMTLLMNVEALPTETNQGVRCRVVRAAPLPEARKMLRLRAFKIEAAVRETDLLPARIGYLDNHDNDILVEVRDPMLAAAAPAGQWKIPAAAGDHVETTALSHLTHFVPVIYATLTKKVPALPPVTGERKVIGTEGQGRLEMLDGVRLLFLKGTPEEMGRQHGTLLEKEIRDLVDHVLYGVGVGSSFAKGRWFFGEIEEAQQHLRPFVAPGYFREMDSLALASGCEKEEVRLANLFPELFHCSGFALFGEATAGGRMYHGRVLDYLRGMGLEQNAVVMVFQPSQGHAWVNIGYAGFVGSVTAMNDQHIAIGEMGGRGEGHWDGKPMAQLMREVMERAGTLDEAVEIMRRGPRTCEYYYVISDGKAKRAVGIAATPDTFEVLQPGQSHPRLPHPFKDAVLMSAGDRYEKLAERVTTGYGKFDAESARALMTRPVAMESNIHSVLFEPETLDFWVANADSENPASHCRYTHLNLGDLLGRKN